MEVRLLTTDAERRIFAHRMERARAMRGGQFRETRRSNIGKVHLEYGELYGLFEQPGESAENMLSGFITHDLATFPQSYPRPDMSHLPPRSVVEGGELWSYSKGAGLLARRGATILMGLHQRRAMLVYPTVAPWDNTRSYEQTNFAKVGPPIEWPYCEMLDGGKLFVQAMVLEGDSLARLVHRVLKLGFETANGHRSIRFENPFPLEPTIAKSVLPLDDSPAETAVRMEAEERNGAAAV